MFPIFFNNSTARLILEAAYLIWALPEIIYSFTHRADARTISNDGRSGFVLIACLWLAVFAAIKAAQTEPQFAITWQPTIVFAAGIILTITGVAFRWYSIRMLGKYFTLQLAIQPGQTVVQAGPYRWIRHPSYTGALITMFGLGLAFTNWLSLIGVLIAAFIGYSYRVMVEERILITSLGEPYLDYMKHTKRFIPFVY